MRYWRDLTRLAVGGVVLFGFSSGSLDCCASCRGEINAGYRGDRCTAATGERSNYGRLAWEHAADRSQGMEMSDQKIADALSSLKGGDPHSLADVLATLTEKGEESLDALMEALRRPDPLSRWAAAAALGELESAAASEALAKALEDSNVSVRIRAAQSLLKLNDARGVPVLIEALKSDEVMIGHPPELALDYANQVLESVTGESVGFRGDADPAETNAAIEQWTKWWEENKPSGKKQRPSTSD